MNNAERAREKLTEELNGTEVKKEETNIASKKEEEKRLRERLKEYAEKRALTRLQRFCRARNLLAKQKSQSKQADLLDEAESIFILNKHVKLGKTKALVLVMMDKNKQNMNFNLRNIAAPRNLIVLPWSTQEFDSVEGLNLLRVKASILSNKLLKENVQVIKGGGYKWKDEPAPIITAPVVEKPMEDPAPVTEPSRPLENTDNQENFFDDDFEDQLEGEKKSEQKLVEPTKSEHQEEPNFFDDSVKEETKPVPEVKQQKDEKYHESEVQASEKIQVVLDLCEEDVQRKARPPAC
jgi:hypothetical protein